jgi:hypothetical protein
MKNILRLGILSMVLMFVFSCKKEKTEDDNTGKASTDGSVLIWFKGKVDNRNFLLNETYKHVKGWDYRLELVKFYISDIVFTTNNGISHALDTVAFIDFYENHLDSNTTGALLSLDVPEGSYTGLSFLIGVDSAHNHSDPSTYSSDHPLSNYKGTHWDWNSGYRFVMIEGKMDTTTNSSGTLSHGFSYHVGFDTLARQKNFNTCFSLNPGTEYNINMLVDLDKLFYQAGDTIDVINNNFTHSIGSQFSLAEKVANNLMNGFIIQ